MYMPGFIPGTPSSINPASLSLFSSQTLLQQQQQQQYLATLQQQQQQQQLSSSRLAVQVSSASSNQSVAGTTSCQVPYVSTSVPTTPTPAKLHQDTDADMERMDENNSLKEEYKLPDYDEHYLKELKEEKDTLSKNVKDSSHILRLLENEINRVDLTSKDGIEERQTESGDQMSYLDIYRERPIRLTVRALIPVREHPKFNFVGKLLGPKGNSMKRLQEHTMTKMAVLGKGSMRDKQKEEELRASQDPKYQHLQEDLHVEITAFAPPAEAHARIAFALTEVRKYLIPDSNDEIRQEQMRELEMISVNGDSVLDTLKQHSQAALLMSLGYPSSNSMMLSPTTPTSTPSSLSTNPVRANTEETESTTNLQNFKATSSLDNSKLRKTTAAPYTKPI